MTPETRRRGSALEEAIFDALFEQLGTVGYGRLTMEGVAAAAQTGKAALYRRWASKEELVQDALLQVLPSPDDVPEHDNVRDDLMALLTCFRAVVQATRGTLFQLLKTESAESKGLLHATIHGKITGPLRERMHQALLRGAERGEVRPAAATERIAQVPSAMIISFCLNESTVVPDDYLLIVVDEIMMPLIRA